MMPMRSSINWSAPSILNSENSMVTKTQEILLTGTAICRGIAIGKPFFFSMDEEAPAEFTVTAGQIDTEIERFRQASERACEEIKMLQDKLQLEQAFDGAAILDAHLQIMSDPLLKERVEDQIRSTLKNADFVFQNIISEYQKKFNSMSDPFFRERFKDIQDLSRRVVGYLREIDRECLANIPQDSIVFAHDLTAYDTAEANGSLVSAFVTKHGGSTSHAAIVAKAKGIPYVSSVDFDSIEGIQDAIVIVDGRTGEIIINPSEETLEKYQTIRNRLQSHLQKLKHAVQCPAETSDGCRIHLSANVESLSELSMIHQYGANGVGLLRTESAFLMREDFPSEEEQFELYRQFVERLDGLPTVVRTFDFGGDKNLRKQLKEVNPFLGCRAIRFSLREKRSFKIQLRAILRASAYGDVRIMFPMVSSLAELCEAKQILLNVKKELLSEGHVVASHIPVGCMIEVPSAAIIADLLAKECDFLSIGTNDLVQYALAVDRTNNALSDLYTPAHPSIVRLIKMIVQAANPLDVPVTVCGEVAADPRFVQLLIGLGVRELSVAPRYLPIIKNAVRNTSISAAKEVADEVLSLSSASEIEELLTREYRRNVPEDCFYNL